MKLLAGVYKAHVSISRTLDLHGDGATLTAPEPVAGPAIPGFYVLDSAKARIYGLAIVNNNTSGGAQARIGFLCESLDGINTPELKFDRVAVETQKQPGFINLCKLTVSRSTLKSPRNVGDHQTFVAATGGRATFDRTLFVGGGGIQALAADVTITNSVLDELVGDLDGLFAAPGASSISVSFSTIYNSPLQCAGSDPATCASAVRYGVCIDNSIINKPSSPSDAVSGTTSCLFSNSIISPQQGAVPGDNNMVGVAPSFKDPTNKDFHLDADSPAVNAAGPNVVVTPDYDGTKRPQGPRSDIGAFELKQ